MLLFVLLFDIIRETLSTKEIQMETGVVTILKNFNALFIEFEILEFELSVA